MKDLTFLELLKILGYHRMSYFSCNWEFVSWNLYNNSSASIYYVVKDGMITQQYDEIPNRVKLFIPKKGYAGDWWTYTFDECINEIIKRELGMDKKLVNVVKNRMRCTKLNKINEKTI